MEGPRPIRAVVLPRGAIVDPNLRALDRGAPDWAAGYALSDQRLLVIRLAQSETYPYFDAGGVLAHEVAHVLIADAAGGSDRIPRWFNEGVASAEQRRWNLRDTLVSASGAVFGPLPTLDEMDAAFGGSASRARYAYAASFDFVRWARGEYGDGVVRDVLSEARTQPFPAAWRQATGDYLWHSEEAWRSSSVWLYRILPLLTNTGNLWLLVIVVFFAAMWARRRKTRKLMEKWEEEEQARGGPAPPPDLKLVPPPEPPPDPEPDPRTDDEDRWVN